MSQLQIGLDISPLHSGHAGRGIGMYTRQLRDALSDRDNLNVQTVLDAQQRRSMQSVLDLLHYPYFDLFDDTLPVWRSRPSVVTIHDVIPLEFPGAYPVGFKGTMRFWKQKFAVSGVEAVITDSEYSRRQILRFLPVGEDQVHVVPLAANPALETPSATVIESTREELRLPDNYILYVGDINYNKNIPTLITALTELPDDIHLVLVGHNFKPQPIPEWRSIQETIQDHSLDSRVTMLSNITGDANEKLSALYHGAVCYVQPSRSEGFGLPVLEAMNCETPVVTSNMGSLPEIAGKAAVQVVPTASGLAEGVNQILQCSAADRAERISVAQQHAETFSWRRTAQETVNVYQKVIGA